MPYLSVTIFSYVFLTGKKQTKLAATGCMNVDVMFAELALNVGSTDVFKV